MPVKPRLVKRLAIYSDLVVYYHNAIAAVFWNLGPECCWIVFNEPRPAGTCLRGLLATATKASGSVYAKSHKSPDWDTAAEEARTAAAAALSHARNVGRWPSSSLGGQHTPPSEPALAPGRRATA